jgi:hypothetical protein
MHIQKRSGSARDVIFMAYLVGYLAAWGVVLWQCLTKTAVFSLAGSGVVLFLVFVVNGPTRDKAIQRAGIVAFILCCLYLPFQRSVWHFYDSMPKGRFAWYLDRAGSFFGKSVINVLDPIIPRKQTSGDQQ